MKRFVNLRLPFIIALSLIVGISVAYFAFMSNVLCVALFLAIYFIALLSYLIFSIKSKKFVKMTVIILLSVIFSLGGYFSLKGQLKRYESFTVGEHYYTQIEGRVKEINKTDNGYMLTLDSLAITESKRQSFKGKLALCLNGESSADIGDVVRFQAYVGVRTSVYDGKLSSSYIERDIKYTSTLNSADELEIAYRDRTIFEKVNVLIRDTLAKGLEGDEFAVAYALLTGNGEYFDEQVITNFRQAGVAHIFAVSGLHIGFLSTALFFIFKKCRLNRYATAAIVIASLFFYSGVCGFSASSIRASIMCSVMLIVKLFGKRYDGLSSLSIACFIILAIYPIQLLCVGFQLSFAVVLGILVCTPFFKRLFRRLPEKLSSSLATVIPAYLFGIPISLYAFSEFSTIAIIVNFLFVPVVGAIFILLLVSVLLGAITHASIVLFPIKYVLKAVVFLINVFDYEVFMVGGFTFGVFAFLYYLSIFVMSGFFNFNKLAKIIITICLAVTCAVGVSVKTVVGNKDSRAIVSGSNSVSFTLIDTATKDTLIISDVTRSFSISRLAKVIDSRSGSAPINVVFLNIDGLDVQAALTKIYAVVKVDKLFYYGKKDMNYLMTQMIIASSFRDVKVDAYLDGKITDDGVVISYQLNGYCALVEKNDNAVAVMARFGSDYAGYDGLEDKPNIVIAYDYIENIFATYKPTKIISYRKNTLYLDAESKGFYTYSLD